MALHKFLLLTVLSILLSSCNDEGKLVEEKIIKEFRNQENTLDSIIHFVSKKYYQIVNNEGYNRIQFVLGQSTYKKGNIISDTAITNLITHGNIISIDFEKSSQCLDKIEYDLVRFKIKNKGINVQYYYVYEYCPLPPSDKVVNGANFKSILLGRNWFLEIEKS